MVWIKKYKGLLITAILIFLGFWGGALLSESKTIFTSIIGPIVWFGNLVGSLENAEDFYKILFGGISLLIYVAIASFIPLLLAKDLPKSSQAFEVLLYTEEISAAMEVIENSTATLSEIEDAVDHLMTSISSEVVNIFSGKVSIRNIRYGFLVSDPSSGNILRVKLAHHFPVTVNDMNVVEWVCANHSENPYLEPIVKQRDPGNDMEVIGLIRNPGAFRFGFVIFLPNKEIITEQTKNEFKAAAAAVQHIAYMDKLYNLMVKFNQNRLTGGGS